MLVRELKEILLKPECVETYLEYHKAVWPELEREFLNGGVKSISCYLTGNRLFCFTEFDSEEFNAFTVVHGRPVEEKWMEIMNTLHDPGFEPVTHEEVYRYLPKK